MDREIVRYLIEIQGDISMLNTKVDELVRQGAERDAKVDKVEKKLIKAESSMKTLRWVGGILFFAIPAAAASIAKVLKP